MEKLTLDIYKIINIFLPLQDKFNICCLSNMYNKFFFKDVKKQLIEKKKWIYKHYHLSIIDLMNGIQNLIFAPILKFNMSFIGIDYIDRIFVEDTSSPIMLGIDYWNRPYITIRLQEETSELQEESSDLKEESSELRKQYSKNILVKKKYKSVITLFQRYTGEIDTWTHGGPYYTRLLGESHTPRIINKGKIMAPILKNNINLLINDNKFIEYINYRNKKEKISAILI